MPKGKIRFIAFLSSSIVAATGFAHLRLRETRVINVPLSRQQGARFTFNWNRDSFRIEIMSEKTNSSGTFRKHWLRQDAFSWIFRVGAVKVTGRDVIILWASAETAQQPVTTVWLASSKDLLVKPAIKHVQNAEMKGATAGIIRETTVAKWADEATGYKPDATLTRIIRLKASGSGFTMGPWKLARRARDIAGALPGPAAKSRAFIVELL